MSSDRYRLVSDDEQDEEAILLKSSDESDRDAVSHVSRRPSAKTNAANALLKAGLSLGAASLLGLIIYIGVVSSGCDAEVLKALRAQSHFSLGQRPGNASLPRFVLENLALTRDECDAYFPLHLEEASYTGRAARDSGGISLRDIREDLDARVLIEDGRMYLKHYSPAFQSRNFATLSSLFMAVVSAPEPMRDVEFAMQLSDRPHDQKGAFGLARRTSEPGWLVADFGLFAWPEAQIGSYANFYRDVEEVANMPWSRKTPKLFWRGATHSDWRQDLVKIAGENKWGDCQEQIVTAGPSFPIIDHAKYRFVAATEGPDSYSGRLKYLLSTRSVVVSHPLAWEQPWHRALDGRDGSPTQNIVFTKGPGWQGLEETMERLLADPALCRLIANNAYETFHERYLSPAATACSWRTILHEHSQCLTFDPQRDDRTKDYESVLLMQSTDFR